MALYDLDITGESPANLISDEVHQLTAANYRDYFFIIPNYAPFFQKNIQVTFFTDTDSRVLTPGIDYSFAVPYMGAIRSLGEFIYGGIGLNLSFQSGSIRITYQTLGGDYVSDPNSVWERLANLAIVYWDQVQDIPSVFPPGPHSVDYEDITGQIEVINSLNDIVTAITSTPIAELRITLQHLLNTNNPHQTTKAQIGLEKVVNRAIANDIDVINRTPTDDYVTLRQVLYLL